MTTNKRHDLSSRDAASRDHAFPSWLLARPTSVSKTHTVSKRPLSTSISRTKMGHENIFGRSVCYNRYNLYRITLFCNKNKKPRIDHVALKHRGFLPRTGSLLHPTLCSWRTLAHLSYPSVSYIYLILAYLTSILS